jgi:hypothetical protein
MSKEIIISSVKILITDYKDLINKVELNGVTKNKCNRFIMRYNRLISCLSIVDGANYAIKKILIENEIKLCLCALLDLKSHINSMEE